MPEFCKRDCPKRKLLENDAAYLYFAMQNLNRTTIKYAADMIKVGMNLADVKALCENYLLENGVLCDEIDRIKNDEWRSGLQIEEYLHKTLIDVATPDMTS